MFVSALKNFRKLHLVETLTETSRKFWLNAFAKG